MDPRSTAHTLRQPLAAAQMHADMLATQLQRAGLAADDPAHAQLRTVLEQLAALADTIDRLFDPPAAPAPDATDHEGRPLRGAMVALVDDDDGVRAGLEAVLLQAGAFVQAAANLPALLALLQDADRQPDLLLTDWRLPLGHNGCDVIQALRQQCGGRALPAFVLTADAAGAQQGLQGLDGVQVLRKPVSSHSLLASLAAAHQAEPSPLERG